MVSEFLDEIDKIVFQYPDELVKIWVGPNLALLPQKPEYIEVFMNNPKVLDKPYFLNCFEEVFGEGLITSSGKFNIIN